ncbi:hypothetical protein BV898_09180 [Hypsibius exemplaris]|uniref:Globin domain-containing protein n=1 Tax=Hypsibius exemplaris TaxID=2072580 RepID=A0A1W0WNA7_HYPEX|nr:hypothetical protein BV898_09180 [Hypsibius exemplaris]
MGQRNGKMEQYSEAPEKEGVAGKAIRSAVSSSTPSLRPKGTQSNDRRKGSTAMSVRHEPMEPPITEEAMFLTHEQKAMIRESFEVLKQTVGDVGVVFFMRLFETHPEVQDVFVPFQGLSQEDLMHSHQLRNHGLRVMGFVEKCVARLEQPEKLVALCLELGARHAKYQVPAPYLLLIPPQFIYAIKPALNDKWSAEMEAAWGTLFRIAIYYMGRSLLAVNTDVAVAVKDTSNPNRKTSS